MWIAARWSFAVFLVCLTARESWTQVAGEPRLKQVLANGATILVERFPQARLASVQLIASSKGCEDTLDRHGWRHLLEHILAKGPQKDLDRKLEAKGLYLTADTTRDCMRLEVSCQPEQLLEAVRGLAELLAPIQTDAVELAREVRIHRAESLLEPSWNPILASAWRSEFGTARLDPHGDLDRMAAARPSDLEALRRAHFRPRNVVLVAAGAIDLDVAMEVAKRMLAPLTDEGAVLGAPLEDAPPPPSSPNPRVRVVRIGGLQEPSAAHLLAAGMALSGRGSGVRVVYTPSARPGLCMLVGSSPESIRACVDDVPEDEWPFLFSQGKAKASAWLRGLLADPSSAATLRGTLLAWDVNARPEAAVASLSSMSLRQFREAASRFAAAQSEEAPK